MSLQTLIFKTNGSGVEYPYGPKKVITFNGAPSSIQIFKTNFTTTKVQIQNKVNWSKEQLEVINSYQKAGYRLNVLQNNGNLQLSGYDTNTTIEIMKVIYVALMNSKNNSK